MANVLTDLIPDAIIAADVVSRELVGFIPSVGRDSSYDQAAIGQTIRSMLAPSAVLSNIVPAVTPPNDGDQTIGNVALTITESKSSAIRWNGSQSHAINRSTPGGVLSIRQQQIAQSMRALVNAIESDLAALHLRASRAYGTGGVTPFASTLTDSAYARKILADNGAPMSDMQLVIDTSAGAAMRTLTQLTRANESADTTMLRQGELLQLQGFSVRESGQVASHTAGTAALATTSAAGFAVGDTSIVLASAGTGTILVGDAISFAGDAEKYIVTGGDTDVSDGGTITIASPGLRAAIPAAATAITVAPSSSRSMAFDRNAIMLATRVPDLPDGGDSAVDREIITDDRSDLSFELAAYSQYRQMQYRVGIAWGVACIKPEHCAVLLG